MNSKLKAILQQLNFLIGRNPRLEKRKDWRKFIPEPYKAVVIISADFELAWAWRYIKNCKDPLHKALEMARKERKNVPEIIKLCDKYNIPITWLIVGHLFLENCSKINGMAHPDIPRPLQFENAWWDYSGEDWFEYDPCTNFRSDPLWYCPDLIEMILKSKVKHEIGCHTFSHIDCRDIICPPEHFEAEIAACRKEAARYGCDKMESFVHPGHTIGNLDTLAKLGFTNYRSDSANILGYPKKTDNGLWEFTTTLELEYKTNWSVPSQIKRYISTLKRAIRNHSVAYFWFHPSAEMILVNNIMPYVLDWLDRNRDEVWIAGQGEYVRWLKQTEND